MSTMQTWGSVMIRRIHFTNFKAFGETSIELGALNLVVGPNGSGKTTLLQAIRALRNPAEFTYQDVKSLGRPGHVIVTFEYDLQGPEQSTVVEWKVHGAVGVSQNFPETSHNLAAMAHIRSGIRTYLFDGEALARPTQINANLELGVHGENLSGVLDALRDRAPERFDRLNGELRRWLPEFRRIVFETPQSMSGHKVLLLENNQGHRIHASSLSQGTLFVLALLSLAYSPEPPPLIGLEEPDHGVHPRLLRRVHDALNRLAYPAQFDDDRPPVQVIATTHSPFLLDLFRDHPEDVILAEKKGTLSMLQRLVDHTDVKEILGDAPLGDLWYSGALGGIPAEP